MPDWKDAPEWAQWLVKSFSGKWRWCENEPRITDKSITTTGRYVEVYPLHIPEKHQRPTPQ